MLPQFNLGVIFRVKWTTLGYRMVLWINYYLARVPWYGFNPQIVSLGFVWILNMIWKPISWLNTLRDSLSIALKMNIVLRYKFSTTINTSKNILCFSYHWKEIMFLFLTFSRDHRDHSFYQNRCSQLGARHQSCLLPNEPSYKFALNGPKYG